MRQEALTGRAKRRVRFEEDALLGTPLAKSVLRKKRVKFDLVNRRNDLPSLLELLEVGDRPIA